MYFSFIARAATVVWMGAVATGSLAQTILTVNTPEKAVEFSLDDLMALPQTTVVTTNDYVQQPTTFQGPSLRAVLETVKVDRDATLQFVALNDFHTTGPASDAFDHDVILATLRDGDPMSIREKGPIWVIYPMDDTPALRSDLYNSRLVWQLREINVL